jgi:hypothetical protein
MEYVLKARCRTEDRQRKQSSYSSNQEKVRQGSQENVLCLALLTGEGSEGRSWAGYQPFGLCKYDTSAATGLAGGGKGPRAQCCSCGAFRVCLGGD